MKDIVVICGSESLFSIVTLELEDMGYSVGDSKEKECRLLIFDANDISSFSELCDIKRKKTLCISRDPNGIDNGEVRFDALLRRPILTGELRKCAAELLSEPEKKERRATVKRDKISLDREERAVLVDSKTVKLSEKEFALFSLLFQNRGNAVSREELAKEINASGGNEVDVYVCYLRRKLEKNRKRMIFTERGVGYKLI